MSAGEAGNGHLAILLARIDPGGCRLADVGCGGGWLTRAMAKRGAWAVGVDCQGEALARASRSDGASGGTGRLPGQPGAAEPGRACYVAGRGEALPFADASYDAVLCFNSLHHVPVPAQGTALGEMARVLVPQGRLYVCEPLAEGSFFDLIRPFDDETAIRAAALTALADAARHGLRHLETVDYEHRVVFEDGAQCLKRFLAVEPNRRRTMAGREPEFLARFEAGGQPDPDGRRFDQPHRAVLLAREAGRS